MSARPHIGIDIGSTAIKVVELAPTGKNSWRLLAAASMPSPIGTVLANLSNLGPI